MLKECYEILEKERTAHLVQPGFDLSGSIDAPEKIPCGAWGSTIGHNIPFMMTHEREIWWSDFYDTIAEQKAAQAHWAWEAERKGGEVFEPLKNLPAYEEIRKAHELAISRLTPEQMARHMEWHK